MNSCNNHNTYNADKIQPQATPDDYYDEERSIFSSSVGESKKPTVVKPTSHSVGFTLEFCLTALTDTALCR